jgi:formylglycine-generating enzyme required for sulfatase activity/tRNA A-37 threonylcarbamoyl transferase component Bud32
VAFHPLNSFKVGAEQLLEFAACHLRLVSMSPYVKLALFGLKQVVGGIVYESVGAAVKFVEDRFADPGQKLPRALANANDRAWKALSIALAGEGWFDQLRNWFAPGDEKALAEQIRVFLKRNAFRFDGSSAQIRKKCLGELNAARQAGLLAAGNIAPKEVGQQFAGFQRYTKREGMIQGAQQVVAGIADDLAEYPNLARLLRQPTGDGPPLLVAAFAYFFRREIETDSQLAHGLFWDGLQELSASQELAFEEVGKALTALGDRFDQVFEQLARIEEAVVETQTVAVATHGAVLDLQLEMQRLASLHLNNSDEVRRLMLEVLNRVSQNGMQKGEVKPQHSFSIRSENERNAVKQLLASFRQMPAQEQKQFPALLNGLGKLQIGSGDFEGARKTFAAVAANTSEASAQAEAHFNAYRAALEQKKWDEALAEIQKAASLDSQCFAPFPLQRYQAKRILGAGGFGTAFLCHDRNFDEEVVVKTLHDGAMERNMVDVFREARLLRKLNHSAIIGVHECEFADPLKQLRPYIVMDYFPGGSLQAFVQERGTIPPNGMICVAKQIAQGMQAAHQNSILHRDLKPDNVLIRKEGDVWKVKVIDFGLALGKRTIETSMAAGAAGNTILGDSVAGTIEYAPPEQLGKLKGMRPGPFSDVYAFGKMFCYGLFKTTEPKNRHWVMIPKELHEMLEQCTEQELEHRLPDFGPVLKVLEALELQRRKAEAQERTPGKRTQADRAATKEIVKRHQVSTESTKHIVENVGEQRKKAPPSSPERKPAEIITNSFGMKFTWIPPGSFLIGSPWEERQRQPNEAQHKVTLTTGFYLGLYPVTQEEWQAVMGNNPSRFSGEQNLPVEQVSWDDCQALIKKLREKDKRAYRLPTEAEWEYACRAGTTTPFSFGETISTDQVNYDGNYTYGRGEKGIYREKTTPVGSFPANSWGLHDMHGNVWEWCQDCYCDYPQSDLDPQGPDNGKRRVLRGGSWLSNPVACRSAFRDCVSPRYRYYGCGVRVCFQVDEDKSQREYQESLQHQAEVRQNEQQARKNARQEQIRRERDAHEKAEKEILEYLEEHLKKK